MLRIAIVGGGPSGVACALTLWAARHNPALPKDIQITLFDAGHSDLQKAALWEVPGMPMGVVGSLLLSQMRQQVVDAGLAWHDLAIQRIKSQSSPFHLHAANGDSWETDIVVLATGFKAFEIELEVQAPIMAHPHSMKSRVCLKVDSQSRLSQGFYVAGSLAGVYSMYATAIGSGTAVACNILSELTGKPTVVHDVPVVEHI